MNDNKKKELNENELEKASSGAVFINDTCSDFEAKPNGADVPQCQCCIHFRRRAMMVGDCDLGHRF